MSKSITEAYVEVLGEARQSSISRKDVDNYLKLTKEMRKHISAAQDSITKMYKTIDMHGLLGGNKEFALFLKMSDNLVNASSTKLDEIIKAKKIK